MSGWKLYGVLLFLKGLGEVFSVNVWNLLLNIRSLLSSLTLCSVSLFLSSLEYTGLLMYSERRYIILLG